MRAADLFLYLHAVAALKCLAWVSGVAGGRWPRQISRHRRDCRREQAHTHDAPAICTQARRPARRMSCTSWCARGGPRSGRTRERARVDALVSEVVAQNAPWPRAGLVGKWRLAYLQPGPKGEGVDRASSVPEFGFNEQYQIFRQNPGRVTNVGEVLGPAVRVEVKGGLEELDSSVTRSPKRFRALIDDGALCAGSACAPLPISGEGLFDGVYLDDRLRVGQNLNGGGARIVQVRVE